MRTTQGAHELSEREEALPLLRGIRYGRVAMSGNALPFVTVARHIVEGGSVLIRIHARLRLRRGA